jgi:hypothetical protein
MKTDVLKRLRDEVNESTPWLTNDLGFEIIDEGYDHRSFGDSWVTLRVKEFTAHFMRARGEVRLMLASCKDLKRLWPAEDVAALLSKRDLPGVFDSVDPWGELLRDQIDAFKLHMGKLYPKTKFGLRKIDERKKAEFFRNLS